VADERDASLAAGSPERFGYSWARYDEILPQHEEQFRRWTAPIAEGEWRALRFLDAGCGIGRNAFWPMRWGAAGGLAIDVDERSLAAARRNLAGFPAVEIRKLSVYALDARDEFDLAFSIGVVHHLDRPADAVARLAAAVRPGGRVLVWLYGRENNGWIVHLADPLRRALFSRLPLPVVHALSWPPTALLWLMLRLGIRPLEYFRLLAGFSFRHLRAIVFDHMIPRTAEYYTRERAVALLEGAGLIDVAATWVNQMSWTVVGRRPG
jgi:SAM-dependent methyltransferase